MITFHRQRAFATTQWTMIGDAANPKSPAREAAVEELCARYWYPLYAFTRRQGYREQEAEDLIQEFFVRFIQKDFLASVGRDKGRFRTFMLVCLKRFLADQWRRSHTKKRGGGRRSSIDLPRAEEMIALEANKDLTPEQQFERRWALQLLQTALQQLTEEMDRHGKRALFNKLLPHLVQEQVKVPQAEIAREFAMTPGALRMEALRIRQRFALCVRREIAKTVADPNDVEDEIKQVFEILRT